MDSEFNIHDEWERVFARICAINPPEMMKIHRHPMKVAFFVGMMRMAYVQEEQFGKPTWETLMQFRDHLEPQVREFFDEIEASNEINRMMAEINAPPPLTEEQKKILADSKKRQAKRDLDKQMFFPKLMLTIVLLIYSVRLIVAKYTDDGTFLRQNWNTMAVMAWLIFVWYYIQKLTMKKL